MTDAPDPGATARRIGSATPHETEIKPAGITSVMMSHSWPRGLRLLLWSGGVVVLVAALSRGQAVLMPFAVATVLAIILTPGVARLERAGLHRGLSVALVLLVALAGIGAFAYGLSRQCTELAEHIPRYSASIESKLAALRATRKGPISQIREGVQKAGHDLDRQAKPAEPPAVDAPGPVHQDVQPVVVVPSKPNDADMLRAAWAPLKGPIVSAAVVLILLSFMLVQREDLTRRLIGFAGPTRAAAVRRTLEEIPRRINQFLFSQSLINATFGAFIAGGLWLIGAPHALLWGAMSAVMRFVPFIGTTVAMIIPAGVAVLESDG